MNLRKVANNTAWIIGCRLVQAVFALFINMLTARYLGPSNFGLINYASSIVAFVAPIMQLGIKNIIVNELVNTPEKEGELLGTTLGLTLASSVCCIVGVISFAAVANADEPETILICGLYSLMLIFQSTEIFQYWFQAKLQSKFVSLAVLAAYIAVSAYKFWLLATKKNIAWFAVSNSVDYLLISVILFMLYKKQRGADLCFSWQIAKKLLAIGRYYIIPSMMVTIFAQTDRIMLKFMMNNDAVGFYSAAVSIAGLTSFVFTAIIHSFQPVIYESRKSDEKAFENYVSLLYGIIFYLSLAQSVVMTVGATLIVSILYGEAYSQAVSALQIVVWYTTFSYFGSVRNVWMLAENKQRYLWMLNLSGALGNVLLNSILIPVWGINGAALSSLVTQIFTNVIMGYIMPPIRHNNRLMLRGTNPAMIYRTAIQFSKR